MISRAKTKTIRFGEPRRSLPRDFFALQHSGEIQEANPWHKLNVTLRVMWIAYLTSQHLEASTYSHQRLAGCCVRFDYRFPSVLPEPKQVRDCVLAAGQNLYISGARFFRSSCVINNHTGHILQCGKIREVRKVWQPDHAHAQTILAVDRRPRGAAFERNAVLVVDTVFV